MSQIDGIIQVDGVEQGRVLYRLHQVSQDLRRELAQIASNAEDEVDKVRAGLHTWDTVTDHALRVAKLNVARRELVEIAVQIECDRDQISRASMGNDNEWFVSTEAVVE